MGRQLLNVLLVGLAFHLIFLAFQTSVFIQQTVVNSIKSQPHSSFTGDAYVSLCITYLVFAVSNWLAPSVIALLGLKCSMLAGASTYALYSASFIEPRTWLFYAAGALVGLGAGPLWAAQGAYLAQNSDSESGGRHAALFWSMLQSSVLVGNGFVFVAFEGDQQQLLISDTTRRIVYTVLTSVCALGCGVILCLREGRQPEARLPPQPNCNALATTGEPVSAISQLKAALKLARSPEMLLLATSFLFTGQLLSFYTGVYGTAIGATSQFGAEAKRLIGLSGVLLGLGEILGGAVFGLLGAQLGGKRIARDTIFVLGYLVTMGALAVVFVNLPPDASLVPRSIQQAIIEPRAWLALAASLLIGFGDACFNTQIYSLLIGVYSDNSVAAFALFKFVQSIGSAAAFLYSTALNLHLQVYLIAVIASLATLSFCLVEWRYRHRLMAGVPRAAGSLDKSESRQDIVGGESPSKH